MDKLNKVNELVGLNRYSDALIEIDGILKSESKNQEAYITKARILSIMGRKEEATAFYESIIDKFPSNIDAYLDLVDSYSFEIELNKNIKLFSLKIISLGEKVKSLDTYYAPFFEIGNAYRSLEEFHLAVEEYNNAIKQRALKVRYPTDKSRYPFIREQEFFLRIDQLPFEILASGQAGVRQAVRQDELGCVARRL